jgi:thioredoxin 1
MASPVDVTDATFAQFLKQNPNVVLDAWAPWCQPCKKLDPIMHELAAEYGAKVAVAKINTEENPQTANRYGIMGLPAVLVFRNGQRVDQVSGLQPKDSLKARFDKTFGL